MNITTGDAERYSEKPQVSTAQYVTAQIRDTLVSSLTRVQIMIQTWGSGSMAKVNPAERKKGENVTEMENVLRVLGMGIATGGGYVKLRRGLW